MKFKHFAFLSLISLLFLGCLYIGNVPAVLADTKPICENATDCSEQIEKMKRKLVKLGGEIRTLSNEIESMDSKISLTELRIQNSVVKIAEKKRKIQELAEGIDALVGRITKLEASIDHQKQVLQSRLRERYKSGEDSPLVFLFGAKTMRQLIHKTEYLRTMETQDNKLIDEMAQTKQNFSLQKHLVENEKAKEERLKVELEQEKVNLDYYKTTLESQKRDKAQLLADTQSDEAKYQELLEKAQKELNSYRAFTSSAGGGIIGPNGLGGGKDGWYFSQRDSRWASEYIGNSSYTVFEAGCLVTSVAMLHNYYGYDMNPEKLADRNEYYFYGSMKIPWPAPKGRSYYMLSRDYSKSRINNALDDGNPVIVGVRVSNAFGTHFLILMDEDNGDYRMYDPFYGPDLDFSDYYNTEQIFEAVVFK